MQRPANQIIFAARPAAYQGEGFSAALTNIHNVVDSHFVQAISETHRLVV
jgi:hypothetical protein